MTISFKKILQKVGLIIWLALPFLLWYLPADYFDYGQSICPSQVFLHKECPGCGLTRSVQHMWHGDFKTAWEYNKLIIIVFPIGIMLYIHILGRFLNKNYFGFLRKYYSRKSDH
ncbi:MAG: DUF2752 domain-containing protein [Flavobacteriales bacterium]